MIALLFSDLDLFWSFYLFLNYFLRFKSVLIDVESVIWLLVFFSGLCGQHFLIGVEGVLNCYLQPISHKEYASSGILFSLCNYGRIIIIGMPNQTIRRCQALKTRKNRPVNPTIRNQSRQDMTITCWLTTESSVVGEK